MQTEKTLIKNSTVWPWTSVKLYLYDSAWFETENLYVLLTNPFVFFPYIISTIIDDVYDDDAIALILLEYPLTYRSNSWGAINAGETLCV